MSSPRSPSETLSTTEIEGQLGALFPADWQRVFSMARLLAVGISSLSPEDLVSETVTKLLSGERVWRRGVHALVTLKVAMHSEASNARKKEVRAPIDRFATVAVGADDDTDDGPAPIHAVDDRTPDAMADSRMQLAIIEKLVAGDEDVELVLMAWSIGLRGTEAAREAGLDAKRYDAARQRLLRKLKPVADARNAK